MSKINYVDGKLRDRRRLNTMGAILDVYSVKQTWRSDYRVPSIRVIREINSCA